MIMSVIVASDIFVSIDWNQLNDRALISNE